MQIFWFLVLKFGQIMVSERQKSSFLSFVSKLCFPEPQNWFLYYNMWCYKDLLIKRFCSKMIFSMGCLSKLGDFFSHFWLRFTKGNHKNWNFSKGHGWNICLRPEFNGEKTIQNGGWGGISCKFFFLLTIGEEHCGLL